MNTNDLTLDGYFGMPFAARLAEAHCTLPHTADRWDEGEQHVNPKDGGFSSGSRSYTEQDMLWDAGIYVTIGNGGNFVDHRHHYPEIQRDIVNAIGRTLELIITFPDGLPGLTRRNNQSKNQPKSNMIYCESCKRPMEVGSVDKDGWRYCKCGAKFPTEVQRIWDTPTTPTTMTTPTRLEQLKQLTSVTWDGHLISKNARDELVKAGLVERGLGWNWLSAKGVEYLINLGMLTTATTATATAT